jgi:hypothetical protein
MIVGSRAQRPCARPNEYGVDTVAFEALVGVAINRDQRDVFALREARTGRLTKGDPASQKRQSVSFPRVIPILGPAWMLVREIPARLNGD